jgi:hypothetical protein
MADDVPSPFVLPDPVSPSASEGEEPQSAQKQKRDSESEDSMSESELLMGKHFKDTTDLPDLVGSDESDGEEGDDSPERMAKHLANELVPDSDEGENDEEASVAGASKPCGKGKHSRPDKDWEQVRRWKIAEIPIPEIMADLKPIAQELYDLSGTGVPPCKSILCNVLQVLLIFTFFTGTYTRKVVVPQPILQSDWRAALLPWKHGRSYETRGTRTSIFYCPMRIRAHCKSELRLTISAHIVTLEQSIPHESDSHSEETTHRLSLAVEGRIRSIVGADMKISSTQVRRAVARGGEELSHHDAFRVKRAVKKVRAEVMQSSSPIGSGFPNTDNIGDVRRYAEEHDMRHMISRHNADDDDFHLAMHDMMVVGREFSSVNVEFSIFFSMSGSFSPHSAS